jgi:hypothetical protein
VELKLVAAAGKSLDDVPALRRESRAGRRLTDRATDRARVLHGALCKVLAMAGAKRAMDGA